MKATASTKISEIFPSFGLRFSQTDAHTEAKELTGAE
jgi:hypothetical protein